MNKQLMVRILIWLTGLVAAAPEPDWGDTPQPPSPPPDTPPSWDYPARVRTTTDQKVAWLVQVPAGTKEHRLFQLPFSRKEYLIEEEWHDDDPTAGDWWYRITVGDTTGWVKLSQIERMTWTEPVWSD